jgi:hypothetical protein
LWVLMVNLVPCIKDGAVTWTTMEVGAQQYIVEGYRFVVTGIEPYTGYTEYLCVNVANPGDSFWSGYSGCAVSLPEASVTPDEDDEGNGYSSCYCTECAALLTRCGASCMFPTCPNFGSNNSDPGYPDSDPGGNPGNPSYPSGGGNPGNTNGGNNGSVSGGGESGNTSIKPSVNLLTTSNWVKQLPGKCTSACESYLQNAGLNFAGNRTNVYRSTYQDGSGLLHLSCHALSTIISVIDRHLDSGRGIIAGLDYRYPSSNIDGSDHFVVITGREYDSAYGSYYYTYMDPGRNSASQGCNTTTNRLYVDYSTNTIHYKRPNPYQNQEYEYTITHVRPNDGNYSGSTTY